MTNEEILEEVKKHMFNDSGMVKSTRTGKIMENLMVVIWEKLALRFPGLKSEIFVGADKSTTITSPSGEIENFAVDKHCYINDRLCLAIECKTYIDKPMLRRAKSDFSWMMKEHKNFKKIAVGFELATKKLAFHMDADDIDEAFFFANTTRNSEKPITKRVGVIEDYLILNLIEYIEGVFKDADC